MIEKDRAILLTVVVIIIGLSIVVAIDMIAELADALLKVAGK